MSCYSIQRGTNSRATVVNLHNEILFGESIEDFKRELGDARIIELRVDCPGGDGNFALAMYDAMAGREVTATIYGRCSSAAVLPVMAAQRITCLSTARILVHGPVNCVMGNSAQLRREAIVLDELTTRIESIISQRTKQDPAVVRAWLTEGDHWFSAPEALKLGLVDEIYDAPKPIECQSAASATNLESPVSAMPESQKLFLAWLQAFQADGKIQVRNRAEFLQEVNRWTVENCYE